MPDVAPPPALAKTFGRLPVSSYSPGPAARITGLTPIADLPTVSYSPAALTKVKLRTAGSDVQLLSTASHQAAAVANTFLVMPYAVVDTSSVRKVKALLRGDNGGTEQWVEVDLIMHFANSTYKMADGLCTNIFNALHTLLAVTGKFPVPGKG